MSHHFFKPQNEKYENMRQILFLQECEQASTLVITGRSINWYNLCGV